MVRYYPDAEGYKDIHGNEYPILPDGQIHPLLQKFIDGLKDACHKKSWGLVIESLNHGVHTGNSMHYRGLAIDMNCFRIDPGTGRNMRLWVTFEEQETICTQVATSLGLDAWIWAADLQTHTHVSIHP